MHLSMFYAEGEYVQKDLTKAADFMKQAANMGLEQPQYLLGCMYISAEGIVERNADEALVWLTLAAARGVEEAEQLRNQVENSLSPEAVRAAHTRAKELYRKIWVYPSNTKYFNTEHYVQVTLYPEKK